MTRLVLVLVLVCASLPAGLSAVAAGEAKDPATEQKKVDRKTATLAEAIEDWVALLELDSAEAADRAGERWAKGDAAAEDLKRLWPELRERHAEFDYRTWIKGEKDRPAAADIADDADAFTVGGHEFGHLHTRWAKTADGWRVERVFMCR